MGTAVLLDLNRMPGVALKISDRACIALETGKIVLSGMAEELLHSEGGSEGIPQYLIRRK